MCQFQKQYLAYALSFRADIEQVDSSKLANGLILMDICGKGGPNGVKEEKKGRKSENRVEDM